MAQRACACQAFHESVYLSAGETLEGSSHTLITQNVASRFSAKCTHVMVFNNRKWEMYLCLCRKHNYKILTMNCDLCPATSQEFNEQTCLKIYFPSFLRFPDLKKTHAVFSYSSTTPIEGVATSFSKYFTLLYLVIPYFLFTLRKRDTNWYCSM